MSVRSESIAILYNVLHDNDFSGMKEKFDLYSYPHPNPKENVTILNYGKINNPRQITVTDACRGLVVESTPPYKLVSRGFDRFIPNNTSSIISNIKRATVKEDGSLIFVWKHNGKWFLSTMHNFADGKLPFADFTYGELFIQIIAQPLDTFANELLNQFDTG
jgi:hypothetical protein